MSNVLSSFFQIVGDGIVRQRNVQLRDLGLAVVVIRGESIDRDWKGEDERG